MVDALAYLRRQERERLERLADEAGSSVEAMASAVISAYLLLMREARVAVPEDPEGRLIQTARRVSLAPPPARKQRGRG